MRNTSSISDRIIGEAVERYLGREGLDIVGHCCTGIFDYVCVDAQTGERVFVAASAGDDGTEGYDRKAVEDEMLRYIAQVGDDVPAGRLRFDAIHIFVAGEDKGLLRHHKSAL